MNKFQKDLQIGHYYEKKSLEYLEYDKVEHIEGYFKEYDLVITKDNKKSKIEVKSDKRAYLTGNLAIEYECNNNPSGITSTTADFWIYFIIHQDSEEVFKIPVKALRKLTKTAKKVVGGDNNYSKMYLIPKNKLYDYLIKNKNKNIDINIYPTMSDQQPTTQDVKPLSYSQRLINHMKAHEEENNLPKGGKNFNMEKVEYLINQFSKLEYEKRKQTTDEMPFGKYKFKKVQDVAKFDKQYLKWLLKQDMMNKYEELKEEINKYL